MITKKEARNIANWMFHTGCEETESGNYIVSASEINERYEVEVDHEDIELICETLQKLYPDAILDCITYVDDWDDEDEPQVVIDFTIGTWFYENDEDDDEEEEA